MLIHSRFLGPGATWDPHQQVQPFRLRGYHPLCRAFQDPSTMITLSYCSPVRQNGPTCPTTPHTQRPPAITRVRFGLIRFRSPLLTEYLFLPVLRCFTSRRSLHIPYIFRYGSPHMTAAGFPHSDILGSRFACQLPEAYRRLLRPSSAPSAKASTLCSYKLPTTKTKYKDARVHCAVLKQRPATVEQPPPHQQPHPTTMEPTSRYKDPTARKTPPHGCCLRTQQCAEPTNPDATPRSTPRTHQRPKPPAHTKQY